MGLLNNGRQWIALKMVSGETVGNLEDT